MVIRKIYSFFLLCAAALLIVTCVSKPRIEKEQFTRQFFSHTILFNPEVPKESPQLALALSPLRMNYPQEQAAFFNQFLYSTDNLFEYRDRVVAEQRENYRIRMFPALVDGDSKVKNWRYSEHIEVECSKNWGMVVESIKNSDSLNRSADDRGVIVKRTTGYVAEDLNTRKNTRYIVLDMEGFKQVKIDDLFVNFQGERRLRDIVYDELRRHNGLLKDQPFTDGLFFSDEPELTFNFFLAEEGLGLHWDAGQLTPLAFGEMEIVLPWRTIRPLLLNSGIELLTRFNIYLFM